MQLSQKILLFAKSESEDDSLEIQATDAVLASDASLQPFVAESLERKYHRGTWGADPHIYVGQHSALDFTIELTGSGTLGSPPPFQHLLRACGLKSVNPTEGRPVVYKTESQPTSKLRLNFHQGGYKHELAQARGSFSLLYETNQFPKLKFKFLGLYSKPTETAFPEATFHDQQPLLCGEGNLHAFKLFNETEEQPFSFELDLGNELSLRKDLKQNSIEIFQRHTIGKLVWAAKADKTYFTKNKQADTGPLVLQHGNTSGKVIKIECPKIQLKDLNYGDQSGELTFESSFSALPEVGNDELQITFS